MSDIIDEFLRSFPILFLVVLVMHLGLLLLNLVTWHDFLPTMFFASVFQFLIILFERRS
jgi:hypothetical protein